MATRKHLKTGHQTLAGNRLVAFVMSLFASSLLFLCCCGPMCVEAAVSEIEAPVQGGCCPSHTAPVEKQESDADGRSCDCGVACSQHTFVPAEGFLPVPTPELAVFEPLLFEETSNFEFPTYRHSGKVDLSRAPPAYLRFQILLI